IDAITEDGTETFDLSDYSFSWQKDGAGFINGTDGTLANAGLGTNNRITGLGAGTYTVTVQNTTSGCPPTSYTVDFEIEDNSIDPVIQLVARTADEYCDNTDDDGTGTIE